MNRGSIRAVFLWRPNMWRKAQRKVAAADKSMRDNWRIMAKRNECFAALVGKNVVKSSCDTTNSALPFLVDSVRSLRERDTREKKNKKKKMKKNRHTRHVVKNRARNCQRPRNALMKEWIACNPLRVQSPKRVRVPGYKTNDVLNLKTPENNPRGSATKIPVEIAQTRLQRSGLRESLFLLSL